MTSIFKTIFTPLADIENESYEFKFGILKSIALIIIWMLLSSFFHLFTILIFGKDTVENHYIIVGIVELLSLPLLIFIFSNTFGNKKWMKNTYKKTSLKLLFFIALIIIAFRLLFDAYIFPLLSLLPESELLNSASEVYENNITYMILTTCISAPIIEEIIFRGIILNGLLNKFKPKTAIVFSAIIFSAAHLNLQQGINAFLLGLVLAYIYYRTRSVYLTIWAHFMNNFSAMFLFFPEGSFQIVLNIIISTIISGILIFFIKKKLKFTYKSQFASTLNPNKKVYVFKKYK